VRIPSLFAGDTNTTIYMYYNRSVSDDLQDPQGVWDSNYRGVWHMNETSITDATGEVLDSTTYSNDGTGQPGPAPNFPSGGATGQINRAVYFPSGDQSGGAYVNLGNPTEMSILNFALLINRLVGNQAGIVHKPLPVDENNPPLHGSTGGVTEPAAPTARPAYLSRGLSGGHAKMQESSSSCYESASERAVLDLSATTLRQICNPDQVRHH
jgi:hypothetical protein